MRLTETTQSLELVTSAAEDVDWTLSYSTRDAKVAERHGTVATATTTAILSAPAAGSWKDVHHASIRNRDTGTTVVTVQKDVSGTNYALFSASLATNEGVEYTPAGGWRKFDANGDEVVSITGALADAQPITVRKNSGANVGTRSRLNLIEGANVTLTVADDGSDGEVDVTIAAASGGVTPESTTYDADFTWTPPAGHTWMIIELQDGGSGGGRGESAADGTARQGGGGGAAGARTVFIGAIAASALYGQVGQGGAGGTVNNGQPGGRSMVSVKSADFTTPYILVAGGNAGPTAGEWGTSGGSGGQAGSVWSATNTRHGDFGNPHSVAGQAGSAGGNGAAGANVTPPARSVTSGTGGGGRSAANADFAGGSIAASGDMAAVAGGLAGGGNGNNGVTDTDPFNATGGSGGGGGTTGGVGGTGGLGCGGGGGGGGVTGGNGGAGGRGWITIVSG